MRYVVTAVVIILILLVLHLLFSSRDTSIVERKQEGPERTERTPPLKHPEVEPSEPVRHQANLKVTPAPDDRFDPSEYASIAGRVVDEGDDGIPDARVSATIKGQNIASTLTDEEGLFELTFLPEGTYTITAKKKGYADAVLTRLSLKTKERLERVILRMAKGGVVKGKVLDDAGEAIPNANVVVYPFERIEGVRAKGTRTDKNGDFRIEDLFPALYRINATHPDFLRQKPEVVRVTAAAETEINIVLARGGTVEGVVINTEEEPVKGANIYIMKPSGTLHLGRFIKTDEEGRFVIRGLPPGVLNLKVTAKDYQTKVVRDISVVAGETNENVRIVLSKGLCLEGVVVDENGLPIKGARVSASTKTGILAPQNTDKNGHFSLSGLSINDTVSLLVRASGYIEEVRRNITLPAEPLKIVLRHGAVLTGRLTSRDELPKNFLVLCFRIDENGKRHLEEQKFITNSKEHTFTIRELPPAVYEIEVSARGYIRTEPVEVDLRSGSGDVTIFIEKRR